VRCGLRDPRRDGFRDILSGEGAEANGVRRVEVRIGIPEEAKRLVCTPRSTNVGVLQIDPNRALPVKVFS